jgi:hypothetical protein
VRKEPFEPFAIHLTDGRIEMVPHSDDIALTSKRVIVVHEDDTWSIFEPRLIQSIDSISR